MVAAGATAKVGEVIAVIGQAGESVNLSSSAAPTPPPAAQPVPTNTAAPATEAPSSPAEEPATHSSDSGSSDSGRLKASPLARKLAHEHNIDLSSIKGSGPSGRVVRKDVEAAQGQNHQTASAPQARQTDTAARTPKDSAPRPSGGTLTPLSKMRDTIARRMQQTITEVPHFYVTTSIDMRAIRGLRETLKNDAAFKTLTVNHFIIKAAAYALTKEPRANCAFRDGQLYDPGQINIGIITAVEDGLLIPVVREVDQLSLKDLAFEANAAIERARAGRPSSQDLVGGTFSISNMGMMDVENFTAIINPGQGAVLAVSSTREEPVVEHGQVVVGHRMKVTLSVDHRIIDGMVGARFLKHFKAALEQPALMLL